MRSFSLPIMIGIVVIAFSNLSAQESSAEQSQEPWHFAIDANLMLTQNGYSDNWTGGESGSMIWAINSNMLAKKALSPKLTNKNTLKLSFGQTHNQDTETKKWAGPVKSTDLIDFETLFRFTLGIAVDPYVAGRIESQFLDASDPQKDRTFNPIRFTESFGVARALMETEKGEWTVRLGAGFREYLNRDVLVDPVTNKREIQTSYDSGFELVNDFTSPLAKDRITFTSKLTLFQALLYSETDELEGQPEEDYWKEIDVNWENIFSASITEYLMVNLYIQLLYDKEIDLGGRFKQTLSLGVTYKFL